MSPSFGRAFNAANVDVVLDGNLHRDDQVPHFNLASFASSALVVLVVAEPPDARIFVAPLGARSSHRYIPQRPSSPRIGGIGMVDDVVLEHERAHVRLPIE